jgi:hypothetical protein
MDVDVPRACIIDTDSSQPQVRILIRENCWDLYTKIRESIPPVDIGVDVNRELLRQLATLLSTAASVSVGWIEIRLTFFSIAIWAMLKAITVVPYEIVASPPVLGAPLPFQFGRNTYEIAPVE